MLKFTSLLRLDRHARRLREIVTILTKYGLADWLSAVDIQWLQGLLRDHDGRELRKLSQNERIRLAMVELGPTFIKLGQMLSTRADIVGPDLADELEELQANTPADPPEVVRETIRAELDADVDSLFLEFDDVAFASASIGQVHRARLKNGMPVVVKVQHADIEQRITTDLEILIGLAEVAQAHARGLRSYQPAATANEFRRTLSRELDFTRELRNLETFTRNFAEDATVHFPTTYREFSGRRVLTMEMLTGISVAEEEKLQQSGNNMDEFARRCANMFLDMVFRDGVYHADPHPGNLMLLEGNVVGVIDCGMVGRIDSRLRVEMEGLLLAAVERDGEELTDIVVRLGSVPSDFDRDQMRAELSEFIVDYAGQTLSDFDLSGALNGISDIIRRYGIILPSGMAMLLKVLVMLEGTSQKMSTGFSLAELMEPYYAKAMRRRLSPRNLMMILQRKYRDWDRLLDMLPRDVADILGRVRRGKFDVNLEHRRLDPTINRLVVGILAAALFVGSTQLWSRDSPPVLWDVSVFGALGSGAAVLLGIRLLMVIKRSGDIRPKD